MNLILDTGILGRICHPKKAPNQLVVDWLNRLLDRGPDVFQIALPELADYELRRKLLHLISQGQASSKSLERLNQLSQILDYLPLDTTTMRMAADLWANSRKQGLTTAPEAALDGDVILAAQAILYGGTIITTNRKHLSRFVDTKDWTDVNFD